MKRLLAAMVLVLVVAQLFLVPTFVRANVSTPTVNTLPATNITPFSATLNGNIIFPALGNLSQGVKPVSDISGYNYTFAEPQTIAYFRYGTSPSALTSSTPPVAIPMGPATIAFSWNVVSLMPCTTYYAQAFVTASIVDTFDDQHSPSNCLIALSRANHIGLGVGLNQLIPHNLSIPNGNAAIFSGAIISFTTPGCSTPTVQHGTGSFGFGGTAGISNISVKTAAISSTRVGPGEKVDITATVANNGTANGATKVTLYINGQEVESKGITLASGQSEPVHFFVTQNDPGTYSVQVGGVSAGSFTVDAFNNNSVLIYGVIALFTLGIAGTLFMLTRKRPV